MKKPKKKTPRECMVVEILKTAVYARSGEGPVFLCVPAGVRGDLVRVDGDDTIAHLHVRWYFGMWDRQLHRNILVKSVRPDQVRFVGTKSPIEGLELPPLAGRDIDEDDIPF